ncbi:hypothetical protein RJ640_024341 [Escallonia rubra]|uniref:HD domain-containing protein n=1 Tax=Escallonia rubra TaxID=112253 RepID=A0AA88S0Q6_9ASTE|nr:hypothetical protein RJ640_024341 [Escallonia rubra]
MRRCNNPVHGSAIYLIQGSTISCSISYHLAGDRSSRGSAGLRGVGRVPRDQPRRASKTTRRDQAHGAHVLRGMSDGREAPVFLRYQRGRYGGGQGGGVVKGGDGCRMVGRWGLRDLKQLGFDSKRNICIVLLGAAHMVYPGAVHSRFEHSLGVYWLAGDAVNKLNNYQGSELGIERFDIQTVKLAGLLHDVGHGPFSHLFEREFLPQVLKGSKWSHEQMSVDMIDHIVDTHHIEIDPDAIKKVKEMILASSEFALPKITREKKFLYDIVANGRNGIDVDKFDYIVRDSRACALGCNFQFERLMETMRVLGDEICYRAKDYLTIHKLFATRADLYRTVYTHAKVKAIELMIVDALCKANDYLQIASHVHDPSQYWKLDDTIIKAIETAPDQELRESKDLILRIRRRDLYQFCNEYAVPKDKMENVKNVTAQDIICSQKNGGVILKEEDVAVSNVRIDLTRGTHNPLEKYYQIFQGWEERFAGATQSCLYRVASDHAPYYSILGVGDGPRPKGTNSQFATVLCFVSYTCLKLWTSIQDYESEEKFSIPDDRISHLLPTSYQDMIVRVYSKKPELVGVISEAFENFQLKTYGIKTQVHATPEKKKRRI